MLQSFLNAIGNAAGLVFVGAFALVVFLYKRELASNAKYKYQTKQTADDAQAAQLNQQISTLNSQVENDDKARLENEAAIRALIDGDSNK